MPSQSVFHWLDGNGWLIFSGGADDDIRALALSRLAADGGVACVTLEGDVDRLLDDVADLGAPSGFLVDVFGEDDATIHNQLAQAGMVIIAGETNPFEVRGALRGAALDGIQAAYENGAVILVEGESCEAFGAWMLTDDEAEAGLEWLIGALLLVGVENVAPYAKPLLDAQPTAIAIAVMPGSALALSGEGQVEIWGAREVTVALGSAYGT